jgi:hypothetical protein
MPQKKKKKKKKVNENILEKCSSPGKPYKYTNLVGKYRPVLKLPNIWT